MSGAFFTAEEVFALVRHNSWHKKWFEKQKSTVLSQDMSLREDMQKLFLEEMGSDVEIKLSDGQIKKIHSYIIKKRAPNLWLFLQTHKNDINWISKESFISDVKLLYSEDDACQCELRFMIAANSKPQISPEEFISGLLEQVLSDVMIGETETCTKRSLAEDLELIYKINFGTDLVIQCRDSAIDCHKGIVASRCEYFRALLSGNWLESQSSIIRIDWGVKVARTVLLYLYTNTCKDPDCDLIDLLEASEMCGLLDLKKVCVNHIIEKFCHKFHVPCSDCLANVLRLVPVASHFNCDSLESQCLNWCNTHFLRTWTCREFSQLPAKVHDTLRASCLAAVRTQTILRWLLDCDRASKRLPSVKWSETTRTQLDKLRSQLEAKLLNSLPDVLESPSLVHLCERRTMDVPAVTDLLLSALSKHKPPQLAADYAALWKLRQAMKSPPHSAADESESTEAGDRCEYDELIAKLAVDCEKRAIRCLELIARLPDRERLIPAQALAELRRYAPVDTYSLLESTPPAGDTPRSGSALRTSRTERAKSSPQKTESRAESNPEANKLESKYAEYLYNKNCPCPGDYCDDCLLPLPYSSIPEITFKADLVIRKRIQF